jgi:aryl-alcohol dehydrogenase-like predicted oxidoreductase
MPVSTVVPAASGRPSPLQDLDKDDWRRTSPRFQGAAFDDNLRLVGRIGQLAAAKGCTPGQLALAWVLAQGDDVIPIPGTKKVRYLEENAAASGIVLTDEELAAL